MSRGGGMYRVGVGMSRRGWVCPVGWVYNGTWDTLTSTNTYSVSHQNTYGWQVGNTHPTGMLSFLYLSRKWIFGQGFAVHTIHVTPVSLSDSHYSKTLHWQLLVMNRKLIWSNRSSISPRLLITNTPGLETHVYK